MTKSARIVSIAIKSGRRGKIRASFGVDRALIAYVLAWLLLGVVAATVLSSAGPIFHDRLFGGKEFAALHETLESRGAWMVLADSNAMWASLSSGRPGMVAGISAVPSIHVAVSLWIFLVARKDGASFGPSRLLLLCNHLDRFGPAWLALLDRRPGRRPRHAAHLDRLRGGLTKD